MLRQTHKAAGDEEGRDDLTAAADELDHGPLGDAIKPKLEQLAGDAAKLGVRQVVTDPVEQLLQQANERAIAWAEQRAGELVVQVAETTRQAVADLVARAEEEGWSNDELADQLTGDEAFAPSRAERIARTETAMADVAGNLEGWRATGVVEAKRWIVADANECDLCADLDGVEVGLDEDFPDDGGDGPPLHPQCRCDVVPILSDEEA